MTLSNLVDNILLIARNSNVAESEHLSRRQIEKWIIAYRAVLIKQDYDHKYDLDEQYTTTLGPMHLDKVQQFPNNILYVSDQEIPKLISFRYGDGLLNVKDLYGNIIQIGDKTKAKYQRYRKATCKDYIAWLDNNRIYVQGDSNLLEYITADVVLEDPTDEDACFDPDSEFPIPASRIPTITQMILAQELNAMIQMPSDVTNDSKDDIANNASNTGINNRRRSTE